MPPNNPVFWGATIWPASEKDKNNIVPFKAGDVIKPLVELTKVQINSMPIPRFAHSKEKPQELRILCLGEGYDKDDLSDFGWIVNADTKEIIWSMNNNRLN